jgi:hypothetical protein
LAYLDISFIPLQANSQFDVMSAPKNEFSIRLNDDPIWMKPQIWRTDRVGSGAALKLYSDFKLFLVGRRCA